MNCLKRVGIILLTIIIFLSSTNIRLYAEKNLIDNNGVNNVDVTPPELDLSSLKIDKKEVKPGDTVNISCKVEDDISGVKYVWIYYEMPITLKWQCVEMYYDSSDNMYKGSIYIDENTEPGEWKVNNICLWDNKENRIEMKAGNYDFSNLNFNVTNNAIVDVTPPELDLNSLKIDKKEVKLGDTVNISCKVEDDISGVKYVWIYYEMPITLKWQCVEMYYDSFDNMYKGSTYIDENTEPGEWKVNNICLWDNKENRIEMKASNYDFSNLNFNVTNDDSNLKPIEDITVVNNSVSWSNKTIYGDVYVGPNAVLSISNNVNIYGNVYVLGVLKSYGGMTITGTVFGKNMSTSINDTLYNGTVILSGSNTITSMVMTTYPVEDIPLRVDSVVFNDEKVSLQGATLDIADMYIEGQQIKLNYNGTFDIKDLYVGQVDKIKVEFKTVFGNVITKEIPTTFEKEDINIDGVIDENDLDYISKYYNIKNGEYNWKEELDLNDDGIIDIYDYVIISKKIS